MASTLVVVALPWGAEPVGVTLESAVATVEADPTSSTAPAAAPGPAVEPEAPRTPATDADERPLAVAPVADPARAPEAPEAPVTTRHRVASSNDVTITFDGTDTGSSVESSTWRAEGALAMPLSLEIRPAPPAVDGTVSIALVLEALSGPVAASECRVELTARSTVGSPTARLPLPCPPAGTESQHAVSLVLPEPGEYELEAFVEFVLPG